MYKTCSRCTGSLGAGDSFCRHCGYVLQKRRVKPPVYSSPVSLEDSPGLLAVSPFQVKRWPMPTMGAVLSLLKLAGLIFLTAAIAHAM